MKVTGAVSNAKAHKMKEDAKDAAKDSGMKKSNAEHGHLRPTDVQIIAIPARSSIVIKWSRHLCAIPLKDRPPL